MSYYLLLLVTLTGCYHTKRPMHCSHFFIYCASQVVIIPDTFISALWLQQRHSSKAGSWREMSLNLANVVSLSYSAGILNT
jgi:hypothetical protein